MKRLHSILAGLWAHPAAVPLSYLALSLITVLTHRFLLPVAPGHLNADFAIYPLTADWIAQGHCVPFQVPFDFGGVSLTALRVPWMWLYEAFSSAPDAALRAHFTFTYGVVPVLLTCAFYFLARAYASASIAFLVGLICSFGFNSWIHQAGVEFYNTYLLAGALLLGIRARYSNPLLEMKAPALFAASALAGLAYYSCRASIVYIVAFFVPYRWLVTQIRETFKSKNKQERWIIRVACALIGLYLYLSVFGSNLGQISGKPVKLHADPNLKLAILLLGGLWFWRNRKLRRLRQPWPFLIAGAGFVTGMLPEIVYWLGKGKLPPLTGKGSYTFQETFTAIGMTPASLVSLLTTPESLARNASIALFLGLAGFAFWKLRRDPKATPVFLAGALALFAYVRVSTYTLAPPRYLLPIFPALIGAVALGFEKLRGTRWIWLFIACIPIHLGQQIASRLEYRDHLVNSGEARKPLFVVETFQKAGVDIVITDSYWHANQHTVISRWKIPFVSNDTSFILPELVSRAYAAERAGILITDLPDTPGVAIEKVTLLGKTWRLKPLARYGVSRLFVGEVIR